MRKSKSITLRLDDDSELAVTCYELRVKDIMALGSVSGDKDTAVPSDVALLESIQQLLPKSTSLTLEQAQELAPSDLKRVYECFQAVNDVFFSIARKLKVAETVGNFVNVAIRTELSKTYASLSTGVTDTGT